MNIKKLYNMQADLQKTIKGNHNLEKENLLPNHLLALRVELGELANAWRGFKHWSINKEMNREAALDMTGEG